MGRNPSVDGDGDGDADADASAEGNFSERIRFSSSNHEQRPLEQVAAELKAVGVLLREVRTTAPKDAVRYRAEMTHGERVVDSRMLQKPHATTRLRPITGPQLVHVMRRPQ